MQIKGFLVAFITLIWNLLINHLKFVYCMATANAKRAMNYSKPHNTCKRILKVN